MTTLVTGATGFIGSALARRLVRDGQRVRATRRPTSRMDLVADISDGIEWIETDVLDYDGLMAAMEGVTAAFHCAAYLGFDGRHDRDKLMRVNAGGTRNVVDAARASGVARLVHTSSVSALGVHVGEGKCMDEKTEWRPSQLSSGYGESKYRAELEVQRAVAEGLDAVIVNPSVVVGEGRPGENTRLLIDKIRSGGPSFMPAGSTNVVDILDVIDGHLKAMEIGATGERYVLGGENLSWREIISTLAQELGSRSPNRSLPTTLGMPLALLFEFVARISRKTPIVTRETVRMSAASVCYRNDKAVRELGCTFRPLRETARRIAAVLA